MKERAGFRGQSKGRSSSGTREREGWEGFSRQEVKERKGSGPGYVQLKRVKKNSIVVCCPESPRRWKEFAVH